MVNHGDNMKTGYISYKIATLMSSGQVFAFFPILPDYIQNLVRTLSFIILLNYLSFDF